jgi:hypothetical protein
MTRLEEVLSLDSEKLQAMEQENVVISEADKLKDLQLTNYKEETAKLEVTAEEAHNLSEQLKVENQSLQIESSAARTENSYALLKLNEATKARKLAEEHEVLHRQKA